MPITITIKQVPDDIGRRLRRRAETNRRSLQRELLLIVERAASEPLDVIGAREPDDVRYTIKPAGKGHKQTVGRAPAGKLTLAELWQRARMLGDTMPSESAALIRRDRDAGHRR